MNAPYNPFGTARSPYDEDEVMSGGAAALSRDIVRADAAEARRDPYAEQMTTLTRRKSQIGHARQAAETLREKFLAGEGAELFEADFETGKVRPAPDGTYILKAGANENDPSYKAKRAKFERIQNQLARIREAGDATEVELGFFAAQRLKRDSGLDLGFASPSPAQQFSPQGSVSPFTIHAGADAGQTPAPATTSTPQGFAMRTLPTGTVRTASGMPTTLREFESEADAVAFHRGGRSEPGTGGLIAPEDATAVTRPAVTDQVLAPAQLVKMHRQMKDAEDVAAMETTGENFKKALLQKKDRLMSQFMQGLSVLPEETRKRVIDATRDPTLAEYTKNFFGRVGEGAGSTLVDMGEFITRQAGRMAQVLQPGGVAMMAAGVEHPSAAPIREIADAMRKEASDWGVKDLPAEVADQLGESFSGMVGQGFGSTAALFTPTTGALRIAQLMGASPKVMRAIAVAVPGLAGGAAEGNALRREAETFLKGRVAAGEISEEEAQRGANQAEFIGVLAGLTESASPLGRWSKKIAGVPAGQTLLRKMAERMEDGGMRSLVQWLRGNGRRAIADVVSEAGEEAFQELLQGQIGNLAARGDLGNVAFDPERHLGEGQAEGAAVGGIVGGVVSALLGGMGSTDAKRQKRIAAAVERGRQAPRQNAGGSAPQTAITPESAEFIKKSIADLGDEAAEIEKVAESFRTPGQTARYSEIVAQIDGLRAQQQTGVQPPKPAASGETVRDATPSPANAGFESLDAGADEEIPVDPGLLEELRANLPQVSAAPNETPATEQAPKQEPINTAETVQGEALNEKWTAFSPESGALGIPRAEMPQVKAEHRGALTNFLKARDIMSEETEVLPSELKPTQAEFSPEKVEKARKFEGGERAILVSSDNYVVDGHHQWMAKLTDQPQDWMRVIKLDAPIADLLETVKEFPSAKAAAGATAPNRPEIPDSSISQPGESAAGSKPTFANTRTDLLAKIDAAMAEAPAVADRNAGNITIQSGRSKFTVTNSKDVLKRLRRLVERKIPANDVPGQNDSRPRDQRAVIADYKNAENEAGRRGYIDQMTPATLKALGLAEKYERLAPGVTLTAEAAQALRDLRAGKRSKFTVQASTGTRESDVDPTAPAALAFTDANEGDYPEGLVQQVREFAASLNAERRRRGADEIAFTPQKPGIADEDRRSRLLRGERSAANREAEQALRFVRGVERTLGKRVVFFKPSAPVEWHAMTSPNRANTILVNVDAGSPLTALIGHEMAHNIKAQNPELYRRMRAAIYATAGVYSLEYEQSKRAQGYSAEKVEDEWIADVIGQRFDEPEFWRDVRREAEARGDQRAFAEFVREAWEWLSNLVRRVRRVFTKEADAGSIRQIEELRNGLAAVLVDYQAQMPAGGYPDDPALAGDGDLSTVEASSDEPRDGWRYRGGADTERAAGIHTVRQIYERRGQKADMETADAIIDELGVQRAADVGLSSDGRNGLDTVLREALLIRTMERATEEATNLNGAERAARLRLVQRISSEHNPDLTEMGQAISMRQNFNRLDNPAGVIDQATREASQAQDTALGGKDSAAKTMRAVKDAMDEGTAAAIKEASKELGAVMRKRSVSKSIWQSYRDRTAARLLRLVEQASVPAPKASLQEFTDRVVSEMRARLAAQLPQPGKVSMPAADLLREALDNREKFGDLFAAVRSKFAEAHGEGSPIVELVDAELANLGLQPYNNRLLDRAIKEAHKALQTSAAELAKQHFTETDPQAAALADALVNSLAMSGPAASELAASISDRAKEVVAEARRKALAKLSKKHDSTKATRRVINAVMRAGLLNNLGAFDVAALRDAVAKELHLPRLTDEQAGKLVELSNRVRAADNDMARGRAEFELLEKMRLYRGVKAVDLLTSMWYANALSSPATHVANFGPGNVVSGLIQVGSVIATNPKQAVEAVSGFLLGLHTGWADAKAIMAKGGGLRDFGDKMGQPGRILEIAQARRDLPGWVPAKGLIDFNVGLLKYVGRLMRAADTVFFHAAKDAYLNVTTAKLLAVDYKGAELAGKVRESLQIAPTEWAKVKARAQREGWQGTDLSLRVANLIQQHRAESISKAVGSPSQEVAAAAQLFAEQATLNQTPEGLAGVVYQGLSYVTQGVRVKGVPVLKPFLMFLRIPTNIFNTSLNLTPIGAFRAWNGSMLGKVKPGAVEGEEKFTRRFLGDDERARLYAQSVLGSLMMAAIATAALDDDDDDRRFDISGKGPEDFPKRQQLEATGWRPYSMKIGDQWISYRDTVMLIPLALVGAYVDAARYSTMVEESLGKRLTNAAAKAPRAIFETSMLQGLGELLDVMRGESSAARIEAFLSRVAVTAQPYVPGTAMLSAIDRTLFPEQREADAPGGALTAAAPFVRNIGSQRFDVLGEPVKRSPWDRFSSAETNDPLREVLRDKGVFISMPSRSTKLGKEVMDEETFREYVRISGDRIKNRLMPLVPRMRTAEKERVEKAVDNITRQEREAVKNILRSRAKSKDHGPIYNPFSVNR